MVISIADFISKAPFEEDYGIGADAYRPITDILGEKIMIVAVKHFTNEKGKGVFILAYPEGNTDDMFYLGTHAMGLVGTTEQPALIDALDKGALIEATIIERKSSRSDRMVYAFAY